MGRAFLLLITLESAVSFALNAVLDNLKRIVYSYFMFTTYLYYEHKITKKRCNEQKKKEKFVLFKLFLVISHTENDNFNK